MKVGILTFPHSPSYGASLQMFALYKTIEKLGGTPCVLNYQNRYMRSKHHIERDPVKAKLLNIVGHRTSKKFTQFEKTLTWLPSKIIYEAIKLQSISADLDYVIVGSDQVWNPAVTGSDTTYFLDFCEKKKKISYAASFGVDDLEPQFAKAITELLYDIPALSIREIKGREIIKRLTGRDVSVVLDPTFLPTKELWDMTVCTKPIVKQPYIFSFVFNPNDENISYRTRLSDETGLPIVSISDNPFKKSDKNSIYVSGIGPTEFLRIIRDAEYIVTDSFHGTAFSIIFNRPFYVSLSTKTNSRLETLLSTLDLENRIISECKTFDKHINYTKVNQLISVYRERSLSFLQNALFGGDNNEQKSNS